MSSGIQIYTTTNLDRFIAEELFGWKWMAYDGKPMINHPQYREGDIRVREFFSPESLKNKRWQEYWGEKNGAEATGDEPLSYRYCSSYGPAMVPRYSSSRDDAFEMEREIRRRKLWPKYETILAQQCRAMRKNGTINYERMHFASLTNRCLAALAVVGSKYIEQQDPGGPEA